MRYNCDLDGWSARSVMNLAAPGTLVDAVMLYPDRSVILLSGYDLIQLELCEKMTMVGVSAEQDCGSVALEPSLAKASPHKHPRRKLNFGSRPLCCSMNRAIRVEVNSRFSHSQIGQPSDCQIFFLKIVERVQARIPDPAEGKGKNWTKLLSYTQRLY